MAKVAFVSFYNFISLPARLMHSVLKESGHEPVSVYFKRHRQDRMGPPSDREYSLLRETLRREQPLLVGLSLRSTYASVAKRVARDLRADGHTVLWGGTHATAAPEDCIEHADAVCVGEGEGALLDVIGRLAAGDRDLTGIPNIWARDAAGQIVKTPQRPQIQDLDTLPYPHYESDGCRYIESDMVATDLPAGFMTSYDLMTSRGCPYRCEFCCHSVLVDTYRGLGKYNRRRSPELVIRELEWAMQKFPTINRVRFWDDIFTAISPKWIQEFATLYKARVGLPFWCYTTSELARPDLLGPLYDAGLRYIGMGIQSGAFRIRSEIFNRPEKTETILKATQVFNQYRIHPEYDIIADNPFETEGDFREALDLFLSFPRPFSLFQHSLAWFPNYPITERALQAGHIQPDDIEHLSGKGFKQWHDEFSLNRKPEHIRWITLLYLTQYRWIPRGLIRALASSAWLARHPGTFNQVVKPFGRLGERIRWSLLYLKERGATETARRFARKLALIIRADRDDARQLAGAD